MNKRAMGKTMAGDMGRRRGMVVLNERVNIAAPFEKLCWWADHFEAEFVKWSPLHLDCDLLSGGIKTGDRVRFREIVMGLDYDVTGTITASERDDRHFRFVFENDNRTAAIMFAGKRTDKGCAFSHTEVFGVRTPVLGPIVNFLIFKVFFRRKANWTLIRQDMILDNFLLKDILESGKYPERIPAGQIMETSPSRLMEKLGYKKETAARNKYSSRRKD